MKQKKVEPERTTPTSKAVAQCAKWLTTCLDLGYDKSQLDELERLWWKHHDFNGKIKKLEPEKTDVPKEQPTVWYNDQEIYHELKRANYSDEIAKELSHRWAHDLQGAFDKGWEQGQKKLGKQLADLRAERDSLEERMNNISDDAESELKECYTERDKLKEDLREHGTTQNRLLSANSDIKN